MNKIEKLINQYCPKGVEYKSLGMISSYAVRRIDAKELNASNYVGVDNLLPNKLGKVDSNYVPKEGRFIKFCKGDILIGNIRPYLKKIWLATHDGGTNGDVLTIQIDNRDIVKPQFLYHVLSSDSFFLYDMHNAKGAKMPRGDKAAVMEYQVPIPPLEVQYEIVRILDTFTELTVELTTELTTELTARKKQYIYYRNQLLDIGDKVDSRTLGELCEISAGGDVPKDAMSKDKTENFNIPIVSNGIGANAIYGYTNITRISSFAVTVAARGTIGYAEYRDYPYYPIIRLLSVIPRDYNVLNPKYLYYCLQGKKYKVPASGIPQLTAPMLKKEIIPVPTMDVQNRIVKILDNFDKICLDLYTGLPAEIEARQKQYEYYRDKLLTFKELSE